MRIKDLHAALVNLQKEARDCSHDSAIRYQAPNAGVHALIGLTKQEDIKEKKDE